MTADSTEFSFSLLFFVVMTVLTRLAVRRYCTGAGPGPI